MTADGPLQCDRCSPSRGGEAAASRAWEDESPCARDLRRRDGRCGARRLCGFRGGNRARSRKVIRHGRYRDATRATLHVSSSTLSAGDIDPSTGKRVLYWHDPMVPGRSSTTGKSPFMDMQLVPVYADGATDAGVVAIDPRLQQNLGVRTAKAVWGRFRARSRRSATSLTTSATSCWCRRAARLRRKLFVRAALDPVRKGQPLAELYVPEWIAVQEEYLSAKRLRTDVDALALGGLADAAAQRMRLAGMSDEQIRASTLEAPAAAIHDRVADRRRGRRTLCTRRHDASPWRTALSSERTWDRLGQRRSAGKRGGGGAPGERGGSAHAGAVRLGVQGARDALLPEVNATTRTLKARIELANAGGRLVPGMFATIDFAPTQRKDAVLVPSEAVIRTGKRTVVIVARGQGPLCACRRRDRRRKPWPDGDPQRHSGRRQRGRVGPVPHRLGSQSQGRDQSHERHARKQHRPDARQ